MSFQSCNIKTETVVAIDVLLTPSADMYAQSLRLNEMIHQNNPETIKLDENHVPHITLLQGYINQKDLPKIEQALHGLYDGMAKESLKAESFFYHKDKNESFAMVRIERSTALVEMHREIIKRVKPFIVKNGSETAFVSNPDGSPISSGTVKYVSNFIKAHSFENFEPHISLGVAEKEVLDSLSQHHFEDMTFKSASLSIYQLGDHGTAQKLLWNSK